MTLLSDSIPPSKPFSKMKSRPEFERIDDSKIKESMAKHKELQDEIAKLEQETSLWMKTPQSVDGSQFYREFLNEPYTSGGPEA